MSNKNLIVFLISNLRNKSNCSTLMNTGKVLKEKLIQMIGVTTNSRKQNNSSFFHGVLLLLLEEIARGIYVFRGYGTLPLGGVVLVRVERERERGTEPVLDVELENLLKETGLVYFLREQTVGSSLICVSNLLRH